jgi:hypothetical protein
MLIFSCMHYIPPQFMKISRKDPAGTGLTGGEPGGNARGAAVG